MDDTPTPAQVSPVPVVRSWWTWIFVCLPILATLPSVIYPFVKGTNLFFTMAFFFLILSTVLSAALLPVRTTYLLRMRKIWAFLLVGTSMVFTIIVVTYASAFTTYGFAKMHLGALLVYVASILAFIVILSLVSAFVNRGNSGVVGEVLLWIHLCSIGGFLVLPHIFMFKKEFFGYFSLLVLKIPLLTLAAMFG